MLKVVLKDAEPLLSATLPSVVLAFLNTTFPVGMPGPEDTIAVSVTLCPGADGFGCEVKLVLVAALVTNCDSARDVLAACLGSPL